MADQTQDGAYEIRLETTQPMPPMEQPATTTRLSAVEGAAPLTTPKRGRAAALAAVGVAAVVGAGVAVTSMSDGEGPGTPELDAPEQVEGFRSFVLETPATRTLPTSVLAIDAGGGPEPDAEAAPEPPPEPAAAPSEASRVEPFEGARLVDPSALTPDPPEIRGIDRLRAVPVDPDLLLAGPDDDDEYDDEYADEYDDEYADEYDDEYDDEYE